MKAKVSFTYASYILHPSLFLTYDGELIYIQFHTNKWAKKKKIAVICSFSILSNPLYLLKKRRNCPSIPASESWLSSSKLRLRKLHFHINSHGGFVLDFQLQLIAFMGREVFFLFSFSCCHHLCAFQLNPPTSVFTLTTVKTL